MIAAAFRGRAAQSARSSQEKKGGASSRMCTIIPTQSHELKSKVLVVVSI